VLKTAALYTFTVTLLLATGVIFGGAATGENSMPAPEDPRVYFAAERTLLAWVRTGLGVIGLGFVVARFGLFLQIARGGPNAAPQLGSTVIGVGLVVLGALAVSVAAWQHVQFCRTLGPGELPRGVWLRWSVWFSAALAIVGMALAAYLLWRSGGG